MADFIAYYRVSTERQGASDLGLDAQRQVVAGFVGSGRLVSQFTEIESGRRHTNWPQLLAALGDCRKRRAVLLIGRLDHLARNVAFISALMENGTDFIVCDMPTATRLTIHILAAVAEHERKMISKRTKAALAEAKRRGTKLGNPRIEQARVLAQAAFRIKRPAPRAKSVLIHAARVGRYITIASGAGAPAGFNPRGPCGPRPHLR